MGQPNPWPEIPDYLPVHVGKEWPLVPSTQEGLLRLPHAIRPALKLLPMTMEGMDDVCPYGANELNPSWLFCNGLAVYNAAILLIISHL